MSAPPEIHPPPSAAAPGAAAGGTARFLAELDTLVRARYPLVQLVSHEEARVEAMLQDLARAHGKVLLGWSVNRGLTRLGGARAVTHLEGSRDPREALLQLGRLQEPALVVLADLHPHLGDPAVARALRELGQELKASFTTVILLSPVLAVPLELEKEIAVLEVPLPDFRELYQLLREITALVRQGNKAVVDLSREAAERLLRAAQGLTLGEAENAFAKAIANDGRLDASDIELVLEERRQSLRKSGLADAPRAPPGLEQLGGLARLKAWAGQRAGCFGEAARGRGIPAPRGVLLTGAPGCGKSLAAQALAGAWGLPLLRVELGPAGPAPGPALRRALAAAASTAPAVLWLDELERGAPAGLEQLMSCMAESGAPLFVAATANQVDALPPALARRGLFDELFFLELPDAAARAEILALQLARPGRGPERFALAELAQRSEGFSGAELAQAARAALTLSFHQRVELGQEHLLQALAEVVPLAASMPDELERLRAWAKARARPA